MAPRVNNTRVFLKSNYTLVLKVFFFIKRNRVAKKSSGSTSLSLSLSLSPSLSLLNGDKMSLEKKAKLGNTVRRNITDSPHHGLPDRAGFASFNKGIEGS